MADHAPPVPFWRRHAKALVASLFVAVGFAWLMHVSALPVVPPKSAFAAMKWWTAPVYLAAWLVVLLLRSGRWYWLLAPIHRVPMRRVLTVSFIGYGALVALPFRLGEFARPALIRKDGQLSALSVAGTVGAERIIDGLILSVMLLITLPIAGSLSPLPDHIGSLPVPASIVPRAAYMALAVFICAFAAMGVFYWRRAWARRMTERVVGLVSMRLARWLATAVERVAGGLEFLPRYRFTIPYLLVTACYWVVNIAAVEFLMWGVGLQGATFVRACVITGVLALGILVPNAPGFFGAFQISVYAGMAMFFPPETVVSEGAAFVFLLYVSQMSIALLGAGVAALLEHVSPSDLGEAELDDPVELERG